MRRGRAPKGTRVVSEENFAEAWHSQVQVAPGFSYGLGWIVTDYQEQPLPYHMGGTPGYNDGSASQLYVTVTTPLGGLSVSLPEEGGERALVVHDPASTDLYVFAALPSGAATPGLTSSG